MLLFVDDRHCGGVFIVWVVGKEAGWAGCMLVWVVLRLEDGVAFALEGLVYEVGKGFEARIN